MPGVLIKCIVRDHVAVPLMGVACAARNILNRPGVCFDFSVRCYVCVFFYTIFKDPASFRVDEL